METAKPFEIPKRMVWEAYKRVRENKGAAGVDGVTLEVFEKDLKNNLYKIWNRMSSGSYFPPPVLVVEIPKSKGKVRKLGIPTVGDRIAQMVVKMLLEPELEKCFHKDSYGYRPNRGAGNALDKVRKNCWRYDWVIDLDIKGFFDNIDHELMMKAVRKHVKEKWSLIYISRWLKASAQERNGNLEVRTKGTPQGGVISPLLANLFLHYSFDKWMELNHPGTEFERYADDVIVHCSSKTMSIELMQEIEDRLRNCKLEHSKEKTKLVYCKDGKRRCQYENVSFDFLGYTFRSRRVKTKGGYYFNSFNPAVSQKGKTSLWDRIRKLKIHRRNGMTLNELAELLNPIIRGWANYYCRFFKSIGYKALTHLNTILTRWGMKTFKSFKRSRKKVYHWLGKIAARDSSLFYHWKLGIKPTVG